MNVAALIVGIGGWDMYTAPLIKSLVRWEPSVKPAIIDNGSETPYPERGDLLRTERLCYAAAINRAHELAGEADWYIVLSNDVLCTGPFINQLAKLPPCVAGPQLWQEHGLTWIVGWCVCIHRRVWARIGGWDENYQVSSWEDVDYSRMALRAGFGLQQIGGFPFQHLDQRQRFTLIPNYWQSETHNRAYFMQKYAAVTV